MQFYCNYMAITNYSLKHGTCTQFCNIQERTCERCRLLSKLFENLVFLKINPDLVWTESKA